MNAFTFSPVEANTLFGAGLLVMLVALVVAIVATRSLLTAILLMSVYSLVAAAWFLVMDAADVAFTEAVVGAGISTLVMLGAILLTRGRVKPRAWTAIIAPALVVAATGGLLAYAVLDLPALGDMAAPAHAHVGRAYLEETAHDIGAPNIVTAVLSSYRGFDTLGETAVIFAAGVGVALMLGFGERALGADPPLTRARIEASEHHVVLRVAAKMLIPLIALYAFYVQFHGDLGAGGGFQAGVILAVAVILHALVFGLADTMAAVKPVWMRGVAALGVLVYSGVGVVNLVNGGAFLDYDHLFPHAFEAGIPDSHLSGGHHHWGQHFGIMAIEIGVLLTVSSTLVTVFYGFAGRTADLLPGEDHR